jgi:L-ornithine N5-oxygenase
VIAVGGKPQIPASLPQHHPRLIHSSKYSTAVPALLPHQDAQYTIAIIGSGQSAAEIFNDLHSRYPNSITRLIIKGAALRPSDDSPFVNEIFDPDRVDTIYHQDPAHRHAAIALDRGTNYGVVRPELLEHIYAELYTQRIANPNEQHWQHRILANQQTTQVIDLQDQKKVGLVLTDRSPTHEKSETVLTADAIIVATGYLRNAHVDILKQVSDLRPSASESWSVGRDYRVDLDPSKVADDAGIWLQGCNENTHGVCPQRLPLHAFHPLY